MKKIPALVCVFALVFTLTACAKIRQAEFYRVGEYNNGWSVLYDDGTEVEEIASLGAAQQPLAIEKGSIYITQDVLPLTRSPISHPAGEILKCGNGICGGEILIPLKNPLMESTMLLILFFAASNGPVIAVFTRLNVDFIFE